MTAGILQFAVGFIKVFWLLLPAVLLVKLLRSRRFKGWLGERRVRRVIRRQFSNAESWFFSNLLLPTKDGSTQLDHLLIVPQGIFVIETKNMRGHISGGRQEKNWTQDIDGGIYRFQNPLHQNYKHTKTLHELLGIPEQQLFSLVVFVGRCTFGTPMPDNVVDIDNLIPFIKSKEKRLFSATQAEVIAKTVQSVRLKNSFRNRRRHIQHVRAIVAAKPQCCPFCGAEMLLRETRQNGRPFWGCSKFPQCRGARNA